MEDISEPKHSDSNYTVRRKPYKVFTDFPDGRVLEFTKEDWDYHIERLCLATGFNGNHLADLRINIIVGLGPYGRGTHKTIGTSSITGVVTGLRGLRAPGEDLPLKRRIFVATERQPRVVDGIEIIAYEHFLRDILAGLAYELGCPGPLPRGLDAGLGSVAKRI